jgi:hypothetical protein
LDESGYVNETGLKLKAACQKFFEMVKGTRAYGQIVDYNEVYDDDLK